MSIEVILEIDGMHCASCSTVIEKKLQALDKVEKATVNPVTEMAYVQCQDDLPIDTLISTVKQAGYTAYPSE